MKNRLKYKLVLFLSVIIFSTISLKAQDENAAIKLLNKATIAFDEQNFEHQMQWMPCPLICALHFHFVHAMA